MESIENVVVVLTCKYCNHAFRTLSGLNQHLRTVVSCVKQQEELGIQVHKQSISCNDCKKTFTSKQSLSYHDRCCKVKLKKKEEIVQQKIIDQAQKQAALIKLLSKQLLEVQHQLFLSKTNSEQQEASTIQARPTVFEPQDRSME